MLLHHYVWWRIGEDYDGFKRIRTSTCLPCKSKLTFVFFYDFPMGYISLMIFQWGILHCWRMRKMVFRFGVNSLTAKSCYGGETP
jgi:hypothetical protein